jgi:ELWxxDGT repeat protein
VAGHLTAVGAELGRSQGSPETTELVVDLNPGPDSSRPTLLDAIGDDRVLFRAGDFVNSDHPWITDGTAAGTRRIAEVQIGWHTVLAGRLVFGGFTQAEGWELWGADLAGGEAARLSNLDLTFGVASSAHSAGRVGDLALFAAADSLHGNELWRSDGTAGGTYRLANLAPDGDVPQAPPQVPANLAVVPISQDAVRVRWDAVPGAQRYFLSVRGIEGTPPFQDQPIFETMELFIVPPGSPISVQVRAENAHGSSTWSDEVSATAFEPWLLPGECPESTEALCLQGGRFRVRVHWRNQHAPPQAVAYGTGLSVAPPDNETTGYFWFFTEDNVELIVKMLDGTTVNGFHWAFYGALSDVEYWITVIDTLTTSTRTYHNPPGQICGRGDTSAFGNSRSSRLAASASSAPPLAAGLPSSARYSSASAGPCQADGNTLCLLDGRYEVQVDWRDQHNDQQGVGRAVPFRDLSGFFWFFHPDNIELVVKLLDGTPVNGNVWVFYGALSDVGYTLRVRETATGDVAEYVNPPGNICGGADTAAF